MLKVVATRLLYIACGAVEFLGLDEVSRYPELGSSELEHVLHDLAPSTGIAAPTILHKPRYTTCSTLVLNNLMLHHLDHSTSILNVLRQTFPMLQQQRRILCQQKMALLMNIL